MKNEIKVSIETPHEDTLMAICIIEKLLIINKININVNIIYDFSLEECGVYFNDLTGQDCNIYVNPINCRTNDDVDNQKVDEREPYCPGSTSDITLFGVTIHEFCHLIQYKVFPDMLKSYATQFPTERFYISQYCNNQVWDECAEIMTLYITNPYLLKLISKPHYDFCKKYFKSPVACSKIKCYNIYNGFPIPVKEYLKSHWGIVYDIEQKKFIRIKNGKTK